MSHPRLTLHRSMTDPRLMTDSRLQQSYLVQPSVHDALYEAARALGIPTCPDFLTREMDAIGFLGLLVECGGAWELVNGVREWDIEELPPWDWVVEGVRRVRPEFVLPTLGARPYGVAGFGGIAALTYGDQRFVMTAVRSPRQPGGWVQLIVLLGPSCEAAIDVFASIQARGAMGRPRLRIWGGALEFSDLDPVSEEQIVLPGDLKTSVIGYVDRFWKLRDRAAALGMTGRRGLLLVGPPGCGKTLLVRHLLTRFSDARAHLFLAERVGGAQSGNPFSDMLDSVRPSTKPAVVALEDLDRLTDSGVVTKEYLLNALDGMISVGGWVLWVATSNDPRGLEQNILDRPGRFDRGVVFPLPGPIERRQLLRLHSPLAIDESSVEGAARMAEGLTGAHIREACHAAALKAIVTGGDYAPIVLREIERMQEQHEGAPRRVAPACARRFEGLFELRER